MSAQVADYTGLAIAVTFIVVFFGLAGYMIKRSMDLDKERLSRTPISTPPGQSSTILKEKELVTTIAKIRCRNCGTLNLEADVFCQNCGAKL